MKKIFILIIFSLLNINLFAQDFSFPPELKWWIDEIQKVENIIELKYFKLADERILEYEKGKISYKNKLYPVLKKWNYYGNQFGYLDLMCSFMKENDKYIPLLDIDSCFAVFDRNENLVFEDFFGSEKGIDSFCWLTDKKIIAVGGEFIESLENELCNYDFIIYVYEMEKEIVKVNEYVYSVKNIDLSKINRSWFGQRIDYFDWVQN